MPKYLSLDESKRLLEITSDEEDNRNAKRDYGYYSYQSEGRAFNCNKW